MEVFPEIFTTFAEVKKRQNSGSLVADKHDLINDNNGNQNEVIDCTSLCLATTCPKTDDITSPQESEISWEQMTEQFLKNNFALKFARTTDCQLSSRRTCIMCWLNSDSI